MPHCRNLLTGATGVTNAPDTAAFLACLIEPCVPVLNTKYLGVHKQIKNYGKVKEHSKSSLLTNKIYKYNLKPREE